MKNRKANIGEKGLTGIEISIIAAIALITIVLSILIPIVFLKIHLVRVVEMQYGYNNADLTLIALLSDEEVYEKLSLYIAGLGDNDDWGFSRCATVERLIRPRLDKLVPNKCYKLSYTGGPIIDKSNSFGCDPQYTVSAHMALPYGANVGEITLEISATPTISPSIKYCCRNMDTGKVECRTEKNCVGNWEVDDYTVECIDSARDCELD